MKIKFFICSTFIVFFFGLNAFAQVGVDKLTGSVNVTIPLYTVSAGGVSLPIAVSYSTSGVKPTDIEGSAGIGWSLVCGGAVTRQLRGLPDDIIKDNNTTPQTRLGWISNTNGNTINGMSISNSSNPPVYTYVATDVSFINSNFGNLSDTEPDLFSVNAPGLSLQFVFDKDHNIRTIPYQDVKITYAGNISGGAGITSFTVTNDRGITYVFAAAESTTRKSGYTSTSPNWFNTDYQQYINGITYVSAWRLTQIHDLNNNSINLVYTTPGTVVPSSNTVQVNLNGSLTPTNLYSVWQKTTPKLLSSITYQEGNGTGSPVTAFNLSYTNNASTYAYIISSLTGFGRSFQFTYNINVHSGDNYKRYFLSNITDPDCNTPINYSFTYNNLSALPDSTTNQLDYWGYINNNTTATSTYPIVSVNPSNTSYDRYQFGFLSSPYTIVLQPAGLPVTTRMIDTAAIKTAVLTQVHYATGGVSEIFYECNDYYSPLVSDNVRGGGIRVKQITNIDSINKTNVTTTYSYLDPTSGLSSGAPLSLPQFAFTQAYTSSTEPDTTKWRKSTVVSSNDLSQDDHSIVYGYVRESRSGAGSTLYQFSIPVTNWSSSTPSGAPTWSPTTIFSGSTTTNSIGYLNNITRSYPFPPSTNYDFERGLPLDITSYDESSNKVSETIYTYSTPQTPVTVTGFKYDINTTAEESYGKYYIFTSAGPLTTQVVNKLYSPSAPTTYRQTTETYAYSGSLHKQVTQITANNSDGTVSNKYIKYVKDYVIASSGDGMTQALLNLQAANVNIPIESYTQITPLGQSATTVSADLVNYNVFTPSGFSLTLPSAQQKIAAPNGVTFTPSSISSSSPNTFLYDATHYTTVANYLGYDYSGFLLSADNGFKHISTALTDHNSFQPAAAIDNARYDEIAFSDFDSKLPVVNFTGTTTLTTTSRSGQYANTLAAGVTLSKTVNRNLLASNYVISAWIQCSGTAGTISATITGGSNSDPGSTSYAVTTTNPTLYPTGWQYCEFKVPITNITTSTISIVLSCSTAVIIDDVWAYPDVAQVSYISYDPVAFLKTAVTNTNGVSSYFSYDKFGRLLFAFDQDKNIVQRKIYASATNETNFVAPAIGGSSTAYNGISSSWSMATPSYNSCVVAAGVTYTWDYGDGTTPYVTASTGPVSHTYNTNGTYTLKLTVSSPNYGSIASSLSVTVSNLPYTAISYNNYTNGSSIASVVFKKHSTGATMYTLTTTQLLAGYNITPDVYDITIYPSGSQYNSGTGQGYGSVEYLTYCFPYTGSSFVQTSVDLTHTPTVNFAMYTGVCP